MDIYDEMRTQLQELIELLEQDVQYTAAVAHGAIQADQGTAQAHQQRAALKRNYGLK